MKTKLFFIVVVILLMSIGLSAQVQSFNLVSTGSDYDITFHVCETDYSSVVIYKPEGENGNFFVPGVGYLPNTTESIIVTPGSGIGNYWSGMTNIFFTVNFTSIAPTEPFATKDTSKCPETTLLILGQETAQPDFTYLWGGGETTPSINLTIPGNVFVTVTGACGEVTDYMEVINYPTPQPELGENIFTCHGDIITLFPGNFHFYNWTTGEDTHEIYVTETGSYAVTVTDFNGCQETDNITVTFTTNPGQEILLVTIDTVSGNNRVTWETNNAAFSMVKIYRETSTDVYPFRESVEYQDGSWTDDVSATNQSWRYKIGLVDTCGNESAMSPYHQNISTSTVPLVPSGYKVEWTPYLIEGGTKSVSNYYVFTVNGLGINWTATQLAQVSGNVTAYNIPTVDDSMFVVGADLGGSKAGIIGLALSNLVNNPLLSVPSILAEDIKIYPNPSTGAFFVEGGKGKIEVYNAVGQLVMSQPIKEESLQIHIPVSGIYTVKVIYQETSIINKVIIQ